MPKMKTRKSLKLRIRRTATGKLVRYKAGRRHLLSNKSGKQRRHGRRPMLVAKGITAKYSTALGPRG